jgi:hypothetical protein
VVTNCFNVLSLRRIPCRETLQLGTRSFLQMHLRIHTTSNGGGSERRAAVTKRQYQCPDMDHSGVSMSKFKVSVFALAISALGLVASGGAAAKATATASIGAYTITFFDLNLTDTVSPSLSWATGSQSSQSSTNSSFASGTNQYLNGAYLPTSASLSGTLGSATASTGAFFGNASATLLGSTANGASSNIQGYAYEVSSGSVTIAPWTGVTITAPFTATAVTTIGLVGSNSEYAQGYGYITLQVPQAGGGYNVSYGYQSAYASYTYNSSNVAVPVSSSFNGTVTMTFANLSGTAITNAYFSMYAAATASSSIAAVPEPGPVALLLAGLAGLALVKRWPTA